MLYQVDPFDNLDAKTAPCRVRFANLNHRTSMNEAAADCAGKPKSVKEFHGGSNLPEYRSWNAIKERCLNIRCKYYPRYGGRGISIFEEWKLSFRSFLSHIGRKPSPKHSVERIDNNGNYEPGNVRWATPKEQARNTRKNTFVTINGETKCVSEWVEHYDISKELVYARMWRLGWDHVLAITTPARLNKRSKRAYAESQKTG